MTFAGALVVVYASCFHLLASTLIWLCHRDVKTDPSSYKSPPYCLILIYQSLCNHNCGWMPCLILFVKASDSCEQREVSEILKMKIYASTGNPLLSRVPLLRLGYGDSWGHVKTSTLLFTLRSINTCGNACMKLGLFIGVLPIGTDWQRKSAFLLQYILAEKKKQCIFKIAV